MKAEIKNLPESKIEILFEVPWEEVLPYLDRAALKLSEDLKVPGFRPGRIPREIVEKEMGEDKVLILAAEIAIKEKYPRYVLEKKLEVIGAPRVEILKLAPENPFCFRAKTEVLPEIQLPDYKKIASEIRKKEIFIEDKEVEDTLNWLQKSRAKSEDLARPVKKGDFVEVEYNSPQIEEGKVYQDRFFLGKGHFVPGFEENLWGLGADQEKEFTVTFPKDYSHSQTKGFSEETRKKLAGKNVNFKVKVKKVQEVKFPEINDEFARSLGEFENLENLKKNIREGILKEKEIDERQRRRNEILEKIAQSVEFFVPETLVSLEKERIFNALKERVAKALKIPFKEYLQNIKKTEIELKDSLTLEAKKEVRNFLILREIGKKEKIEVGEPEIEKALNEVLKNYPNAKIAKEKIDLDRLKEYYRGVLYNEKVFEKLESFLK